MNKNDRSDLFKAYHTYLSAFNNNDIEGINNCVKYPLSYIGADTVTLFDEFPISPKDMKATKGWDASEAFEIDIVAIGENKAHLLMRNARRLRKDGSLIEEATGFYAYTRTDLGWKMFALSDIVFPA